MRIQHLWNEIDRSEPNACHVWTGYIRPNGYGEATVCGVRKLAHIHAWEMVNGAVPKGMRVLHSCDVRSCVNVNHLWLGTPKDNAADMVKKGRHANQMKTHCVRGHVLAGKNIRIGAKGDRVCLLCQRIRHEKAMVD